MGYTYEPDILKACDVRGVYGSELKAEDGYHLGKAFASMLHRDGLKSCALGYDGRLSSPEFSKRVLEGLIECGIDVRDLGVVPSPVVYHAVKRLPTDAGVMITASHNPAEYNGCKFVLNDRLFHGNSIQQLAEISRNDSYFISEKKGSVTSVDIRDSYNEYLSTFVKNPESRSLKVVWDPGNGASGEILQSFVKKLDGEQIVINGEIDGHFPNHHPDPSLPKNMLMLKEKVLETQADVGIAFDGDGDRIGAMDNTGRTLTGDQLLALFARDHIRVNPGATVMSEVKAGSFFYRDIAEHGGVPLMWKVGHSNQKEKMIEEHIGLAGETSGHIFFEENYGFDDGMFAAVKLLNLLSISKDTLSAMVDTFPVIHNTGEIRIHLETQQRKDLIVDIAARLQAAKRDYIDLDGVRVPSGDGFWILRGSNTQPHITIYCESETVDGLKSCKQEMIDQVEASGYTFEDIVVVH